jgi:hypothetical protein
MAQLVPIAALATTGLSLYGSARQQQASRSQAAQQEAGRAQLLAAQQAADTQARATRLAGTQAAARARLAAGGVAPDEGSAAALTAGLQRDAATAQSDSDATFAARLAAGRRSLLSTDGSLTPWLRAGNSLGGPLRSLLE